MQYRRAIIPGGTFVFTLVTDRRRPILASDESTDVLRNAFRTVRQLRPFGSRFGRFVKAGVYASDGGAPQCALKAPDMSRADDAMSGYAALSRSTGLS